MKNRLLILLAFILLTAPICFAQNTTTVSATVTDPSGQAWNNGTISYVFQPPPNTPGPYYWNGAVIPAQYLIPTTVQLNNSAYGTWSVPTSTTITPAGSVWKYSICPNATSPCTALSLPTIGSTQDISSSITAALKELSIPATNLPIAYSDAEIKTVPQQGALYFNVTGQVIRFYNGSAWNSIGSGTITAVTATAPCTSSGGTTPNIACNVPMTYAAAYGVSTSNSNNDTEIAAAIAATPSTGCLVFPPGAIQYDTPFTLPSCTEGTQGTRFLYKGGSTSYAVNVATGYRINLSNFIVDGQGEATNGINFTNVYSGTAAEIMATNVTGAGFYCDACQTITFIHPTVSYHVETFTTQPVYGIELTGNSADNTIIDPQMEGVSGAGIYIPYAINNYVIGGTSEDNSIGIECDGVSSSSQVCEYNSFSTVDLEANSTTDVLVSGNQANYNSFIGITSASTASIHVTSASGYAIGNLFSGGLYSGSVILDAGAYLTSLSNFRAAACPTDNSYSGAIMNGVFGGGNLCPNTSPFSYSSLSVTKFTSSTPYTVTLSLPITFANDVANQKVDLYLPAATYIIGSFRVTLVDTFQNSNNDGEVQKLISAITSSEGTINSQVSRYVEAQGLIASVYAINDLAWDSTNSRWKITIACQIPADCSTSALVANVSYLTDTPANAVAVSGMLASAAYTTDTTVYPTPVQQLSAGATAADGSAVVSATALDNGTLPVKASSVTVASARKGTFACTAAGTITIANTNELVTSDVIISLNTAGGTVSTAPAMSTVTSGTGFTVLCGAADTSTYNYSILN